MRSLLPIFAFAAVAIAAPIPKSMRNARPSIDGSWKQVSIDIDFERSASDGITWSFDTGTGHMSYDTGQPWTSNIGLELSFSEPGEFNTALEMKDGNGERVIHRTRYRYGFDGDKLIVACYHGETDRRPDSLEPAEGRFVFVLERIQGAKK